MFLKVFLVFSTIASATYADDEKVTVGFTCDELQNQRDTHEAKFGLFVLNTTVYRF